MMTRALTMLNETGDTTISWSSDRDEIMREIIQKKMDEGCVFFIIEPRLGTREPVQTADDAMRTRALAIPDEHFVAFIANGDGKVIATPKAKVRGARKSKDASEIAKNESVGLKPRQGG